MPTFTNNSDGPRGVNVGTETVFLEPGETRDFDGKVDAHPDLTSGKSHKKVEAEPETDADDEPATDGFDSLTDDELRTHIEDKTNEKPHHRASRAKLLEIARGL